MKKLLALGLGLAILAITGCGGGGDSDSKIEPPQPASHLTGLVIEKTDTLGDDNGPGTYTYPMDSVFQPKLFDLKSFKIIGTDTTYDFYLTMGADFKNEWHNKYGFDIQLFDIYLNLGTGKYKQTISGRHVKIAEGWDKAIIVAPVAGGSLSTQELISKYCCNVKDDISNGENLTNDIIVPTEENNYTVTGNALIVKLPKEIVGKLSELKSVQVFVMGSDGYPADGYVLNRAVDKDTSQWRFGGGTAYEGNPNVIDILGDNLKLANYTSTSDSAIFPTINMIAK